MSPTTPVTPVTPEIASPEFAVALIAVQSSTVRDSQESEREHVTDSDLARGGAGLGQLRLRN